MNTLPKVFKILEKLLVGESGAKPSTGAFSMITVRILPARDISCTVNWTSRSRKGPKNYFKISEIQPLGPEIQNRKFEISTEFELSRFEISRFDCISMQNHF